VSAFQREGKDVSDFQDGIERGMFFQPCEVRQQIPRDHLTPLMLALLPCIGIPLAAEQAPKMRQHLRHLLARYRRIHERYSPDYDSARELQNVKQSGKSMLRKRSNMERMHNLFGDCGPEAVFGQDWKNSCGGSDSIA
jgi:hypothetical protein